MLFGARSLLLHRPIICFSCRLIFSSSPKPQEMEEMPLDKIVAAFIVRLSVSLVTSYSLPHPSPRSLFASKLIQAGDCILKVPFNVQISPDNVPLTISSLLADEVGNVAKLAVVILGEQKVDGQLLAFLISSFVGITGNPDGF